MAWLDATLDPAELARLTGTRLPAGSASAWRTQESHTRPTAALARRAISAPSPAGASATTRFGMPSRAAPAVRAPCPLPTPVPPSAAEDGKTSALPATPHSTAARSASIATISLPGADRTYVRGGPGLTDEPLNTRQRDHDKIAARYSMS